MKKKNRHLRDGKGTKLSGSESEQELVESSQEASSRGEDVSADKALDDSLAEDVLTEDNELRDKDSAPSKPFPIVGVGASAGGLDALAELLRALPHDSGMAFVLVQHMDPTHESFLNRLLSKETGMPVEQVSDGTEVEPNHVYVIPPNHEMTLRGGILNLGKRRKGIAGNNPIDSFFTSLAQDQKGASIGIILSGIGSDGTLGCKAIKAAGGRTFAQDEQSAKFSGMPSSAFFSGSVDLQLSIQRIAEELVRAVDHPFLDGAEHSELVPGGEAEKGTFSKILRLLRAATGVDFAFYKPSTIRRRVARRMILNRAHTLEQYVTYLTQSPKEVQALFEDILIHVTSFFREPEVFQALSEMVFTDFKEKLARGESIRIWVPGCSTGEEVYSITMSLLELVGDSSGQSFIQVFGTDISNQNIERARLGLYPESALAAVDPNRLKRFFVKAEGGYRVAKFIRDLCIFARHDLGKDPPFSKLDLISCRNVLICLGSILQKRAISIFHYALKPNGVLLLGKSETIMAHSHLFELEDRQHKIYRKRDGEKQPFPDMLAIDVDKPRVGLSGFRDESLHANDSRREAERIVLDRYSPPGMLLDDRLQIIHFQGDVSPYLKPSMGQASFDLVKMIRPELVVELRKAVEEAKKTGVTQRREKLQWSLDGKTAQIDIEAVPLRGNREGFEFLVLFLEPLHFPQAVKPTPELTGNPLHEEIERLKGELDSARQYLRSVIEDSEASSEELRAANEEVLSSNEELQSTNEELETAKEELQSANEELTTLNEEMHNRNEDLAHLANDLSNLLAGMEISVVILGADRKIRRFTPAAERMFNLIPADIGRSITNIKGNVEILDLDQLITETLKNPEATVEREVQDRDGRWYSLRMRTYKMHDADPDAIILALVDVDSTKRPSDAIVETLREPLLVLDSKLDVISANPAFYDAFNVKQEDVEKQSLFKISNGEWNIPALRSLLLEILPNKTVVRNFQVDINLVGKGRRRLNISARQLFLRARATQMILLMITDETEQLETADALLAREETLRLANAKLRSLSGELIVQSERTSRKLARDLHDAFAHDMLALSLKLKELEKQAAVPASVSKNLRTLSGDSRKLATAIQEFARGLHPAVLEELGLGASLKAECAAASKLYNTPVTFTQKNVPTKLPHSISSCLYRITQEALRNISQHSRARQAKVQLEGSSKQIQLVISDDGRGFVVDQGKRMGGLGLIGMEERARLLGGSVEVESAPGDGCTIRVHIPLKGNNKPKGRQK